MNLREQKYQPQYLAIYCPVCGLELSQGEWGDYGMHLQCTEYCQTQKCGNEQYCSVEKADSQNSVYRRVG